jgi:DNA-binding CsgD family transcriptional regulator
LEDTVNIQTDNIMTGDPAFAVNRRGIVTYWNPAAEQSLGYSNSEAVGKKCWELLCGQDSNGNRYCVRHCPLREMAFRHEPVHGFQVSFITASHQPKDFSIGCLAVFDETGDEMLLHICHPENGCLEPVNYQIPAEHQVLAEEHTEPLSQREMEVLSLLAEKVSTKAIADRLGISIRTVRTHIQHLMYKLHVHKRLDAIEVANRYNLI